MDMDVANFKDRYAKNERNFRGLDLSGADLSNLKLDDIDFRGANLQRANFQGSTLQKADFRGSELKGTIFKKANLQYANFEGMNLEYANFAHAKFEMVELQDAIRSTYKDLLHQAKTEEQRHLGDFLFDKFEFINFEDADLRFANLKRTILSHANFRHTILLDPTKNLEQTQNKTRKECTVKPNRALRYKREFYQEFSKLAHADQEFFKSGKYPNPYSQLFLKRSIDRRGQYEFRQQVLKQYGYRCLITDCDAVQALEAAHIEPYAQYQNNDPSNGLLLRADIHTLFDLNLIAIDENTKVHVHSKLRTTVYWKYNNTSLILDPVKFRSLNKIALENRYNNAIKYGDWYFQLTIWDACDRLYE